jgi:hypothetical protein
LAPPTEIRKHAKFIAEELAELQSLQEAPIVPFVGFCLFDTKCTMLSVDSVLLSGARFGETLETFKAQLLRAAEFTERLEALPAPLQTSDAENIIDEALRGGYFPVVRSMYGVLLPQWLVHDGKWKHVHFRGE